MMNETNIIPEYKYFILLKTKNDDYILSKGVLEDIKNIMQQNLTEMGYNVKSITFNGRVAYIELSTANEDASPADVVRHARKTSGYILEKYPELNYKLRGNLWQTKRMIETEPISMEKMFSFAYEK